MFPFPKGILTIVSGVCNLATLSANLRRCVKMGAPDCFCRPRGLSVERTEPDAPETENRAANTSHCVTNRCTPGRCRFCSPYLCRLRGSYLASIKRSLLTPRLAGGLCFPCRAAGRGVFSRPLSRLLGHVATRDKRQSKERQ